MEFIPPGTNSLELSTSRSPTKEFEARPVRRFEMMKIRQHFDEFLQGSSIIKIATIAAVSVWSLVLVALIAGVVLVMEIPGQSQSITPAPTTPAIILEPTNGPPGTTITIRGEGWTPDDLVLIYLMAPGETEPASYAIAGNTADVTGQFVTGFVVPSEAAWAKQGIATVIARTTQGGASAQALFSVLSSPEQPTATPVTPTEPAATPTETLPPTPTATPQPGEPTATASTDLNIRSGPGTAYPVLGVLRAWQTAEITGVSADAGWWQIKFAGTADGRGWISAKYVTTQNTSNVPVVQAPPLPPTLTPTPVPTSTPKPAPTSPPVVITDWRGEYYNNLHLNGAPVLVRNDFSVGFDWGNGSPGSGVPADNFSARWTRDISFSDGSYRFYTRVDDGVRLWVDGNLIIDQWHDSGPITYSADIYLTHGVHRLRMEYYERSGTALAQLAWEQLHNYPDWKAEYYNNRNLKGDPVLVRNETKIKHNWKQDSPAAGVSADNFSARWTRKVDFKKGTYLFSALVDDGIRLWVDDTLVIDSWKDGSSRLIEVEHKISKGKHQVEIEYFEHQGDARIEVSWEQKEEPSNKPPQALPGGPYTVNEGSLVTFDGSGSKDPDGSISKYEWDFDYQNNNFSVDATGKTASASYADGPATVTIALRVTDNQGTSHVATAQVTVKNVAPTGEAGGPYVGLAGNPITLAGTGTDPGAVDQAGLTYHWAFGDGSEANGPVVSHSYAQPGNYTATLTVTDKDGGHNSDTATVQVDAVNQPPTAVINGPASGLVGEALNFSGSNSSDSDGNIDSYSWNFGDGTKGNGINVTHTYTQAASYQVTLTVKDNGGLTNSTTHAIQINEPAPINQPPIATITGPATAPISQTVQFDGSGSTDADGSIVKYDWDFGQGTTSSGITVTHVYTLTGNYQVTLTVTDNGGLSDTATQPITITPAGSQP